VTQPQPPSKKDGNTECPPLNSPRRNAFEIAVGGVIGLFGGGGTTRFTCFAGTKVQILTQLGFSEEEVPYFFSYLPAHRFPHIPDALVALLVQKYTY
jgi:hypothetical protein